MHPSEEKIAAVRNAMRTSGIDAFVIPNTDPHLGEYIHEHWRIIAWLTGFTGSAATVVVTETFAGLWTDSRYFIQAERQLRNSGIVLIMPQLPEKYDYVDWLIDNLNSESCIGLDGRTLSLANLRRINTQTNYKKFKITFESDLISPLWTDRSQGSGSVAFEHPVSFCGKERSAKISEVRAEMHRLKVNYHLLTSLDEIMWLLNIRGNDVKFSPLLISFAIVGEEQILFFVDESKIPLKLAREFDKLNIVMLPYEETSGMLSTLPSGSTVLLNPETTSVALFNSIPDGIRIIEDIGIPTRFKAVKNRVEIENLGRVMIKDGVALTKFFFWIEINSASVPMSELSLTEKLNHLRSEQEHFLGPSFSTIVGYNEHAALPHYSATSDTDSVIGADGLLLVDSGGQYLDGTTDITRTISFGIPTSQQKRDFTLVLKGAISLASAKFPSGTRGYQLDMLARKALWERGLNYGHGTGHGVGFCLNVHEGPQSISPIALNNLRTSIDAGMLLSDEPGIYREGEYGIRLENLVLCYEDEETQFGRFLKFDTISLCYIDKSLIDFTLLNHKEIAWLNSYHTEVYDKLNRHLTGEEREWLKEKTLSI